VGGGAVLAAFFVFSTAVGRLVPRRPGFDTKGERRDQYQVVANGAPPPWRAAGLHDPGLGLWVVTGSLAAAAADTWATSVGGMSRRGPRLLLLGRAVPPGTSGGMTAAGCGPRSPARCCRGRGAAAGAAPPCSQPEPW